MHNFRSAAKRFQEGAGTFEEMARALAAIGAIDDKQKDFLLLTFTRLRQSGRLHDDQYIWLLDMLKTRLESGSAVGREVAGQEWKLPVQSGSNVCAADGQVSEPSFTDQGSADDQDRTHIAFRADYPQRQMVESPLPVFPLNGQSPDAAKIQQPVTRESFGGGVADVDRAGIAGNGDGGYPVASATSPFSGAAQDNRVVPDIQPVSSKAILDAIGGLVSGESASSISSISGWSELAKNTGAGVPLAEGSLLKQRFVLEKIAGRGGMGVVFKARDLRKVEANDRNPYVAVKILNENFKKYPDALKALQRESRKSQNLAHPNIVTVFDFDRDGDNVYMTMEFMDGVGLDSKIKQWKNNPIDKTTALDIINQMGFALAFAHQNGIVHSDFKPGNVFVNQDGKVKVFDFGIARATKVTVGNQDSDRTLFDAATLGAMTPAYASLEMHNGMEPAPADDVYALGCVAYELLTGTHPFGKVSAKTAALENMKVAPVPGLTAKQRKAIQKSLAFHRKDRYQTVEAFLADMQSSPLNKRLIAVGAVVSIVVVAGGIALLYPTYREKMHVYKIKGFIDAGNNAGAIAYLADLKTLDEAQRKKLVMDLDTYLTVFFVMQIDGSFNPENKIYSYPKALYLFDLARFYFDDSAKIKDAGKNIEEKKLQLMNQLTAAFNTALSVGRILPSQGDESVEFILDIVRQVDPGSRLLVDSRLVDSCMLASSRFTQAGNYDDAGKVLAMGLRYFPNDPSLVNESDRLKMLATRLEKESSILAASSALESMLESGSLERDSVALESAIQKLEKLDSTHDVLLKSRNKVLSIFQPEFEKQLQNNDFSNAEKKLAGYRNIFGDSIYTQLEKKLLLAKNQHQQVVAKLLEAISISAQDNKSIPDRKSALALLQELADITSDKEVLEEARAIIAQGYISQSQTLRTSGKSDDAIALLEKALEVVHGDAAENRISKALADIRAERAMADVVREGAEQEKIAISKKEKIDKLKTSFDTVLSKPRFDEADLANATSLVDDAMVVDPGASLATEGRQKIAARVAAEATTMTAAQDYEAAKALLKKARKVMPQITSLSGQLDLVESQHQNYIQSEHKEQALAVVRELDNLLLKPVFDIGWQNLVAEKLKKVEEIGGLPSAQLQAYKDKVARAYLGQAVVARQSSRFSEARALLDMGRSYVPVLPEWEAEISAVRLAEEQFAKDSAAKSRVAKVEGLKQTFVTQCQAKDVRNARKTFAELSELSPEDPFIQLEAPAIIGDAYTLLINDSLQRKQIANAVKLLKSANEISSGHQPLVEAGQKVERESRKLDFIAVFDMNKAFDHDKVVTLYRHIQDDEKESFPAVREALAREIKTRISEISVTKPIKAAELLSEAKKLMPEEKLLADMAINVDKDKSTLDSASSMSPVENEGLPEQETYNKPAPPAGNGKSQQIAHNQGAVNQSAVNQGAGVPCTATLAGYGSKQRAVCFDMLPSGGKSPPMVVVPGGGHGLSAFAIGKYEVSVGDFNLYCKNSGTCKEVSGSAGLPVTGLSLQTIQGYADWLSSVTGFQYSLPSEIEWEYAAMATGFDNTGDYNCKLVLNGSVIRGGQPNEIKNGKSNSWGLVNFVGNVREVVASGNARGGNFMNSMAECSVSLSEKVVPQGDNMTGFRLKRSLGGG